MDKETFKKFAVKTARLLDDKKAEEVKIYDLLGLSTLCDYIIIASANSAPHLNALEQDISTELKKDSLYKTNRDGGESGNWRVSDYGGFMLHIMTPAAREFYALDKVFSFSKAISWAKPVKKAAPKKPAAKKTVKKPVKKAKKPVKKVKKAKK